MWLLWLTGWKKLSFFLQGHNQIVIYSRAAYFCMFCSLIWILEIVLRTPDLPVSTLYGITIVTSDTLQYVQDILVGKRVVSWNMFKTLQMVIVAQ